MAAGGARNRSGPKPDPSSARSDQRGFKLTALPSEGFSGKVPDFPLPGPSERELVVWADAWSAPQACAWSMPSESWRVPTVGMWVRLRVRCEDPDVSASVLAQLHRFADQVGMTTAGLAEMGWRVAVDEVSERRVDKPKVQSKPARRMRAVPSESAG